MLESTPAGELLKGAATPTPPTQEKVYVTREEFLSAKTAEPRLGETEIAGLGWCEYRSLNDREYTEISAAPMKKDGSLDKVIASAFAAKLIVKCCTKPKFNDSDVKALRDRDAAIIDQLATAIREHIGVRTEEEVKNG